MNFRDTGHQQILEAQADLQASTPARHPKRKRTDQEQNLIRLGVKLYDQIAASIPLYDKARKLHLPLHQSLDAFDRRRDHNVKLRFGVSQRSVLTPDAWKKREAVRTKWEASNAGKRYHQAWRDYCSASDKANRTAKAILKYKPRSVAGVAYYVIAASYENDWPGPGYAFDSTAMARILLATARAARIELPTRLTECAKAAFSEMGRIRLQALR